MYYKPAPVSILEKNRSSHNVINNFDLRLRAKAIENTLNELKYSYAKVSRISSGPTITRYEVAVGTPANTIKAKKQEKEICTRLRANSARIVIPTYKNSTIWIEIPNEKREKVYLGDILDVPSFNNASSLVVGMGKESAGGPFFVDLARSSHLLICGESKSGKTTCINDILVSLLCKVSPKEVRLVLIDTGFVDLTVYDGIPHLIMPVVTDLEKSGFALQRVMEELESRYRLFAEKGVKNLIDYNNTLNEKEVAISTWVVVIDDLADLLSTSSNTAKVIINRLIDVGAEAGVFVVASTQRPSAEAITSSIRDRIPTKIAFKTHSGSESRMIIKSGDAEKLLGCGDMLFLSKESSMPIRVQSAMVSEIEISSIVSFLDQRYGSLDEHSISKLKLGENYDSALFCDAVETVLQVQNASASSLQRRLGISFNQAMALLELMEAKGFISPFEGSKPRRINLTDSEWNRIKKTNEIRNIEFEDLNSNDVAFGNEGRIIHTSMSHSIDTVDGSAKQKIIEKNIKIFVHKESDAWHVYDTTLNMKPYNWGYMLFSAEHMLNNDLKIYNRIQTGKLGAKGDEIIDITPEYKMTHQLKPSCENKGFLAIEAISGALKLPITILWFHQTNRIRIIAKNNNEILFKEYIASFLDKVNGLYSIFRLDDDILM